MQPVFGTLEDFVERWSGLIGSPAQVIEKVHRYHEQFGHSVLHLHADAGGLTDAQHRASLDCSSPTSPRCCAARSPTLPGAGAAARSATTRCPPGPSPLPVPLVPNHCADDPSMVTRPPDGDTR